MARKEGNSMSFDKRGQLSRDVARSTGSRGRGEDGAQGDTHLIYDPLKDKFRFKDVHFKSKRAANSSA